MIIMNCNTLNKSFIQLLAFFGILLLFSCDNSTEPKDCAGVSGGDAFKMIVVFVYLRNLD